VVESKWKRSYKYRVRRHEPWRTDSDVKFHDFFALEYFMKYL